jgi:ParB-like chromosome segregation protein Spo0J
VKKIDYIKSAGDWGNSYAIKSNTGFRFMERVRISKIKKRKRYRNRPSVSEVISMVTEFYPDAWEPIMINERFFLIDGQHRLMVAKRLGLKYIDAIVANEKRLKES